MKETAKPFVKWVGGKRQLIEQLRQHVPNLKPGATYHEPFVGGGALFFALEPKRAVLTDTNERLIRTYRAIQDYPGSVINRLRCMPHSRAYFLQQRKRDIDLESDVEVAAWFIYLNKTCFNGLYRVNKTGRFNAPFGDYKRPLICDERTLLSCASVLRAAQVGVQDFQSVLMRAKAGDFVYFDPPYVPVSKSSDFTSFTKDGFTSDDQERLLDVARELKRRRVHVLLSNSSAPLVYELYEKHFKIKKVGARRSVNSNVDGRGDVTELIIY